MSDRLLAVVFNCQLLDAQVRKAELGAPDLLRDNKAPWRVAIDARFGCLNRGDLDVDGRHFGWGDCSLECASQFHSSPNQFFGRRFEFIAVSEPKNNSSCLVQLHSTDFHSGLLGVQGLLVGFDNSITR